jgi:poly-gamma-glutamate capsule biosynthesis protein CapA/YwtB (metallophosphatase superfamily)
VSRRNPEGARAGAERGPRTTLGYAFLVLALAAAGACQRSSERQPPTPAGANRGAPETGEGKAGKAPPPGFTIAASGDILIHSAVAERAARYGAGSFDFRPMFAPVRPLIAGADLAVCHLETPLSETNEGLSSYPIFNAPREVAQAAAYAGFDFCSTASNHSYDRQMTGVSSTLDVLDEAGLAHAGTARSRAEWRRPTVLNVNGFKVGLLSYTYGLNWNVVPARPWSVNVIDPPSILAEARRARAAGADFVVVSLQWGVEYRSDPTRDQRRVARRLLRSPVVDLILGHHAHVIQPIGRVGREYALYGMGNFLSNQSSKCCLPATRDGVIVRIEVTSRNGVLRATGIGYSPTWVDIGSYRILPIRRTLEGKEPSAAKRRQLRRSWTRTVDAIESGGVRPERDPGRPFDAAGP